MRWNLFRKIPHGKTAPAAEAVKAPDVIPGFRLNLLTAEQKLALRKHLLVLTLRDGLFVLLIEAAILGSILLASRFILDNTYRDAVEQSVRITRTFSGNNQQIKALNEDLGALERIAAEYVPMGDLYGGIVSLVPPGITVTGMTFDVAGERFRLRGSARSREDLTELREALWSSPLLADVDSPLSNLFVKQDIPFEFSATLNRKDVPAPIFILPAEHGGAATSADTL
jgi:hypothetical protein